MGLLDPARVRRVTVIVAIMCALVHLVLLARTRDLRLPSGDFVFGDLIAHVAAGKIALSGDLGHLYDPMTQARIEGSIATSASNLDLFLSPPFMALVWAPLALLPYFQAGLVWNALTVLLSIASARWIARALSKDWISIALVLFSSAPFWMSMAGGQESALALALFAGAALAYRTEKEILLGVLLGLGVFKPQLFWLAPFVLVATRKWRALATMIATAVALGAISIALVGMEGMRAWLALLRSPLYLDQMSAHAAVTAGFPAFARSIIPWRIVGWIGSALVLAIVTMRARTHPSRAIGLVAFGSLLGAPHAFVYDATILAVPCAELWAEKPRAGSITIAAIVVLTWLVPWMRDFMHVPIATMTALAIGFYKVTER